MLYLPSVAVQHIAQAVRKEIARLEEIAESVVDFDEWGDDDPNDLGLYCSMLGWLEESTETGLTEVNPATKSFRFVMALVPGYARANRLSISSSDMEVIFRTYCEYVAIRCLADLPWALEHPNSSFVRSIQQRLSSLIDFPGK